MRVPSFAATSTPACMRSHRIPNPLAMNGLFFTHTGLTNDGCHRRAESDARLRCSHCIVRVFGRVSDVTARGFAFPSQSLPTTASAVD